MITRKPKKGDRVAWRDHANRLLGHGTVTRVEGTICFYIPDKSKHLKVGNESSFIWKFKDGLNQAVEFLEPGPDEPEL